MAPALLLVSVSTRRVLSRSTSMVPIVMVPSAARENEDTIVRVDVASLPSVSVNR